MAHPARSSYLGKETAAGLVCSSYTWLGAAGLAVIVALSVLIIVNRDCYNSELTSSGRLLRRGWSRSLSLSLRIRPEPRANALISAGFLRSWIDPAVGRHRLAGRLRPARVRAAGTWARGPSSSRLCSALGSALRCDDVIGCGPVKDPLRLTHPARPAVVEGGSLVANRDACDGGPLGDIFNAIQVQ
jgi:hypothetical protein